MSDIIREEVDAICAEIERESRGCHQDQGISMNRWFNVAVLNVLWTIVTGVRMEYDDPKLKAVGLFGDDFFWREVLLE